MLSEITGEKLTKSAIRFRIEQIVSVLAPDKVKTTPWSRQPKLFNRWLTRKDKDHTVRESYVYNAFGYRYVRIGLKRLQPIFNLVEGVFDALIIAGRCAHTSPGIRYLAVNG